MKFKRRRHRDKYGRLVRETACGRYRVLYRSHAYGIKMDGPRYIAERLEELDDGRPWWEIVSKHRNETRAMSACRKDLQTRTKAQACDLAVF